MVLGVVADWSPSVELEEPELSPFTGPLGPPMTHEQLAAMFRQREPIRADPVFFTEDPDDL